MNTYLFYLKKAILISFVFFSIIVLSYFYYYNQQFDETSIESQVSWTFTISYFILYFYFLFFLINLNIYNKIFFIIILTGTPIWILIYFFEFFNFKINFLNMGIVQDATAIICFSIVSPGLILNFFKYIKNNSNQDKKRKLIRKYHIHEGFFGILFILIGIFFWIIRSIMIQYKILKTQLRIYLALDMILLFLFLFSGSFLIFRDWRDFFKLKFFEKRRSNNSINVSSIFNPIDADSLNFFKFPKLLLYPFGILFSSFSVNLFIHGTDFLPEILFKINHEIIVLMGIILCLIAGAMIGIDWYRLFARLYPHLYQELEQILKNLVK